MKTAIFDIGSNSVRMLLAKNFEKVLKVSKVTKLSEGLNETGVISENAKKRTLETLVYFFNQAKEFGAEEFYAFGTEALRKAKNSSDFVNEYKILTGIDLQVISGEREAELGINGALKGGDGGLIDLGGASMEISVCKDGKIIYGKSLPIGIVRVKDYCNGDIKKATEFADKIIPQYGEIPFAKKWVIIGGTATHLTAIKLQLDTYDADKVNGYKFCYAELEKLSDELCKKTPLEIMKMKGASKDRSDTVAGGSVVIKRIMQYIGLDEITVSEDDNLDGFLLYLKERNNEKT